MSATQEVGEIFGDGSGAAQALLRSPEVIIASIALWGMNVFFFRRIGIDYVRVLNHDLVKEREQQQQHQHQLSATGGGSGITNGGGANGITEAEEKKFDDASTVATLVTVSSSVNQSSSVEVMEPLVKDPSLLTYAERITWYKLLAFSALLFGLLPLTIHVWMEVWGGGFIGAVFCFYALVVLIIIFPFPSTRWLRTAAGLTIYRCAELFNPRCSCLTLPKHGPRPIPFVDVYVADGMCSLSKVLFDWGMLGHLAYHYPHPVPPSTHAILIPSACAAVPYLLRARQCLIMYTVGRLHKDPKRINHILNAIKYSTSIFPICLSAYQQTLRFKEQAAQLEYVLIVLLVINALYAYAWDITMDWGMFQNPAVVVPSCVLPATTASSMDSSSGSGSSGGSKQYDHPAARNPSYCADTYLRPRLRFGIAMSFLILVADGVLRFSWLLRFVQSSIFPSKDHFVLCTQFLEVFRRAIWNLLRVEWENIKHQRAKGGGSSSGSSPTRADEEGGNKKIMEEVVPLVKPSPIALQPIRGHTS